MNRSPFTFPVCSKAPSPSGLGALLLLWLFLLQVAVHAAPIATVSALSGPLSRRVGNTAVAIGLRTPLNARDVVHTGVGGKATLLFLDGSQVRLNANTTVEITAPSKAGRGHTSLIRALSGEVWARLRPGRAVQSSSAIAGVRGTAFNLVVADDGTSTLSVFEGEVDFFNPFGAVNVAEQQQSVARPGQAPTQPIVIANPGLILEWTLDLERAAVPRELFFITPDRAAARRQLAASGPSNSVAQGDLWFDAGDFARARTIYLAALNAPTAAQAAIPARFSRLALENIAALDTPNPDPAAIRARLGLVALEVGDIPEAEAQLAQALALPGASNASRLLAHLGTAWLEIARGRPALAVEAADRALALDNQSLQAQVARGVALMRLPGQGEASLQAFTAALALPGQAATYQARSWRALQLLSLEQRDEAVREAKQAAQEAPASALAQGNLALVLMFSGDAQGAVRAAKIATRENPESVAARVALGQTLLAQGEVDKAETEAARAVALDPQLPQARYLLGVAEASRRDYGHAARDLQAALRLAPDFLPAAAALARVETARGRKSEAVQLLAQLQERRGKSAATLSALGQTLFEQSRYKEAEDAYREAVKLNPNSAQAWVELAMVLDQTNRLNEAIIAAQKAVQLAPTVAEYHALLGQIYFHASLFGQSTRELRTALAIDPRNALARGILGTEDRDGRVRTNSIAQAFLFDPNVTKRILRGGVNAEITPTVGSDEVSLIGKARFEALDGKLRYFGGGILSRYNEDENSIVDEREWATLNYLTYAATPRTTLFNGTNGSDTVSALAGPDNNPFGSNVDDRYKVRYGSQHLALRHRLTGNHALWLSAFYEPSHIVRSNPDQITFPFPFQIDDPNDPNQPPRQIFDFLRSDTYGHSFVPEVRADFNLGASLTRPTILTVGAARQRTNALSDFDLSVPGFDHFIRRNNVYNTIGYAQLSQSVNEKLSYVAQFRVQRERQSFSLTGNGENERGSSSGVFGLPSFLMNYHLNNRTALRFFANTRRAEATTAALAPLETALTTEPEVALRGDPNKSRNFELDIERYLREGEFLKVFAFRTSARDLTIGSSGELPAFYAPAIVLNRASSTGAGVRYEKRLAPTMFANSTFVARKTRSNAQGFAYDGATAPYQPKNTLTLGLDYIHPKGRKAHFNVRREGRFFADDPDTPNAPRAQSRGRWLADVTFELEPSIKTQYFLTISNLFDREGLLFAGYPGRGRTISGGVALRF